jgi:mRNA deadenylase 3'-5' endonuclease subunit Ccr4
MCRTNPSQPDRRNVMSFTVATYNILASTYIRPEWYAGVPAALLRPESRVPAVVRRVAALDADILCLQEVERDVFAALDRFLGPLGYAARYEQKGRGKPDGCATFLRAGDFTVRRARRLGFRDRGPGATVDSGHIALLLTLEHDGRQLGVANTHVRWDEPGTPREEQVGYRQVAELIEACRGFDPPCRDWVVCGDFNYAPDSEVVGAMRAAGYAFAHAGRPNLRSAVANGRALLLDYIFHTAGLRPLPVDPPIITDGTTLPAPGHPSDHLALVAEFH